MILVPTHSPAVFLNVREDSPEDFNVLREIWCEDVYHVKERIRDAKLVVDIGANIGAFTCLVLHESPDAKVIAIEPEDNNLDLLHMNVERVDKDRCIVSSFAVSNYDGRSSINNDRGNSRLGEEGQSVNVTTIDSLIDSMDIEGDIDIMKIDIEGSEVEVMESMSISLQQRVKFFTIEFDHKSNGLGAIVEKLTETHHVRTLGAASRGAMIYAERY